VYATFAVARRLNAVTLDSTPAGLPEATDQTDPPARPSSRWIGIVFAGFVLALLGLAAWVPAGLSAGQGCGGP
jgi:hypothetical protein